MLPLRMRILTRSALKRLAVLFVLLGGIILWCWWSMIMVTDTAPLRYPHYHTEQDMPDKLDYERLSRVVAGLDKVLDDLVNQ